MAWPLLTEHARESWNRGMSELGCSRRAVAIGSCLLAIMLWRGAAADSVWLSQKDGPDRVRHGKIVDYRADYLILQRGPSHREKIAAKSIVRIETSYNGAHQRAEAAFSAGRFSEAQQLFQQAMEAESREWVQRAELARIIECDRNAGRDLQAAQRFMILARHDPTLLHLDAAPIHWRARNLTASMRKWAREHLRDETFAVSRLIAASWLLGGDDRTAAMDELTRLERSAEGRVSQLATMQQWRVRWPGMSSPPLEEAAGKLISLPEPLRKGGGYVIAQTYDRTGRGSDAVLWWLRVALLYGNDARLASDAMWRAADRLQREGETAAAKTLFFELTQRFASYPEAARAAERLRASPEENETAKE